MRSEATISKSCSISTSQTRRRAGHSGIQRSIENATAVLLLCTEEFTNKLKREAGPGGVNFEGTLIRNLIFFSDGPPAKFIPIQFGAAESSAHIPIALRDRTRYRIGAFGPSDASFDALVARLTNPSVEKMIPALSVSDRIREAAPQPDKELYVRFLRSRSWTRFAALCVFVVVAILFAWSRSPNWLFKFPFDLFIDDTAKPLTIPPGFAPIVGPFIVFFLFFALHMLNRDTLAFGKTLTAMYGRVFQKQLLDPPFFFRTSQPMESTLFVALLLICLPSMTLGLSMDFLFLEHDGSPMWQSLYKPMSFYGVIPIHRGHSALISVFGGFQTWAYVAALLCDLWILLRIFVDSRRYDVNPEASSPTILQQP